MKIKSALVVSLLMIVCGIQSFAHPSHEQRKLAQSPPITSTLAAPIVHGHLLLPKDLPQAFSIAVATPAEQMTLRLQKNRVFGENTRWLVEDDAGVLTQIASGLDGSYLGKVVEHPEYSVSAVLTASGLLANIIRPGQETIVIEPVGNSATLHQAFVETSGDSTYPPSPRVSDAVRNPAVQNNVAFSSGPIVTRYLPLVTAGVPNVKSRATRRPKQVMDVLEYEIGVEIGSKAFFADTYGGSLDKAKASAQSLIGNLDARFLHSAGIKHRLGTVVIRTDAKRDPLRDKINKGDVAGLNAFRDYWNSNPDKVGTTHDLAVYHVYYPPSGIAYVNTVGENNRYALSCGRGATSWADGTITHEFGHSWNLHHNNKSGFFYEARPRHSRGMTKAGGNNYHVSIMHGGGNHNIGRLATEEADMVYRIRQQRRNRGDLVRNPGPIPPFGYRDLATIDDAKPLTIDVVANDYDCNNDVLDAQLLDTVSYYGGKIALSRGTGPGRRNELVYTPPARFSGRDFFHYTVIDSTGLKDWGAVYVTVDNPVVVDVSKTEYDYDFGPQGSVVRDGWQVISPKTRGDIHWRFHKSKPVDARDRGLASGVNNINRDFVYGAGPALLSHKIANGTWEITLNLGDRLHAHDQMLVKAEGATLSAVIDSAPGEYPYCVGEVVVTDGELSLAFTDRGGVDPNWVVTRLSLRKVK